MNFQSFPVGKIWVAPDRHRQDAGDITGLKVSINTRGLINPIVIEPDGKLIAGFRRLSAVKELGWDQVQVQFRPELSDEERELLEYDENAHRKDLTWQENAGAILKFHELAVRINGTGWTQEDSAEQLGLTQRTVQYQIQVARAIASGEPDIAEAAQFSTAFGILERRSMRRQAGDNEKLNALLTAPKAGATGPLPVPLTAKPIVAGDKGSAAPILNASFLDWAPTYAGPRFNLIHCDFPYGVQATENKHKQFAKGFGEYADEAADYAELIQCLGDNLQRLAADSCHLLFWFATKTYSPTFRALESMGWKVNPTPLVWFRSDNSGILPDPSRMPRQVYETAFLASRGDRVLVRAKANTFPFPNTKEFHMSEKPRGMLTHFLTMLVDEHSVVLDPTCGSGNALVVAKQLKASHILGLEKEEEFYNNACVNWKKNAEAPAPQETNL